MRWLLRLYQQTMHTKRIIEAIETKVYIDWRTGKTKTPTREVLEASWPPPNPLPYVVVPAE